MKQFVYRVKSVSQGLEEGCIWAETKEEAKLRLYHQGYFIIAMEEVGTKKWFWTRKKWTKKGVIAFSFQLGMLLEAGISIRTILQVLDSKESKFPVREMKETLDSGSAVYQMLEQVGFPALGCTLVRAGEVSGSLGESFLAVKLHYEKLEKEKEEFIQLMAYPTFIFVMMVAFFLGAVLFILPNFQTIFESLGTNLPYTTKLLFRAGELLRKYWPGIAVGHVLVGFALYQCFRMKQVRYAIDERAWRLFGRKAWYGGVQYARLFRVLGLLLSSGITLFDGIALVGPLCSNQYVRGEWEGILLDLQGGKNLSDALKERGIGAPVVYELIGAGEMSGELDQMLQECSAYYEKEVMRSVQWIARWMEPIMMTILGIGVGVLVLSIMMPLFQSVNQMGSV